MSMLDELGNEKGLRPGPLCALQKIRVEHGDDVFSEVLAVCMAANYTTTQKGAVLENNGFDMNRQTIERHTTARLKSLRGCVRCNEWLS